VKVLIVGLGKMGTLHKKYLDMLKVQWDWYDPCLKIVDKLLLNKQSHDLDTLHSYTHVIIAAPTQHHADYLKLFSQKNYLGKILVEKPGVMNLHDLELLKNPSVSVGMVERFNPAFSSLQAHVEAANILSIDFVRCSARPVSRIDTNSFIDVGIHDLDLFCQLFDSAQIKDINTVRKNNTFCITIQMQDGPVVRFIWSNETFHRERQIVVRQTNYNLICDLAEQVLKKYSISSNNKNTIESLFVEKKSPLLAELENFLYENDPVDAIASHKLFLELLQNRLLQD
jgi:predicted dehydrogenase